MSAAHLRSGAAAAKSRPRRLSATGWAWAESVVRTRNRRTTFDRIPAARITLATVFSHALTPCALSCAATRGLPYVPRLCSCTALTWSPSSARRPARADGGRFTQA